MRKTTSKRINNWSVIAYPEGVKVGSVDSGKDARSGKVRHVAYFGVGGAKLKKRVGTFDTFNEAKDAVLAEYRFQKEGN